MRNELMIVNENGRGQIFQRILRRGAALLAVLLAALSYAVICI